MTRAVVLLAGAACLSCGAAAVDQPLREPAPSSQPPRSSPALSASAGSSIRGAGSTFVYPILRRWSRDYYQHTEVEVVYDAVGSSAGLQRLDAGEVDFAATDIPLPANELERRSWVQWPIVAGAVVPVVNLLVEPGGLTLDGPVLAAIYLGEIDTWDHPRLRELNPGVSLPASPITVVQRGDASGTAYNFSLYLSEVSLAWRQRLGVWSSSARPVGVSAGGNSGVAELVRAIPNSIGYVSFAYAREAGLVPASMLDRRGRPSRPSVAAFRAAMKGVRVSDDGDFEVSFVRSDENRAWPILAATYVVMQAAPDAPDRAAQGLRFFSWCYAEGAPAAEESAYVAMPAAVSAMVKEHWEANLPSAVRLVARAN